MSLKTATQLAFLVSVSTLLAAVANLGDGRIFWVVATVVSHLVLIILGSKIISRTKPTA